MLDSAAKLIEAIVALIGALAWPLLGLFIILYFGGPLKRFLDHMGEATFKVGPGGVEASAKRQAEAVGLLTMAEANRGQSTDSGRAAVAEPASVVQAVTEHSSGPVNKLEGATILWVDDRPANNNYERAVLETLGMRVVTSTSTTDALRQLAARHFDAVISDMGRPADPRAGYTLLEAMQKRGTTPPFIIYASSNSPEHQAEARQKGAVGCTNSPTELVQMVTSAIQNSR